VGNHRQSLSHATDCSKHPAVIPFPGRPGRLDRELPLDRRDCRRL